MFNVGKRVAVLGGYERDNWKCRGIVREYEDRGSDKLQQESNTAMYKETIEQKQTEIEKPWELCKLYLPDRKRWDQVRIPNFPEMECIAITTNDNVFVMGRKKGDKGITMGWISEDFSNI
jgi:hypothetical protein